MIQIWIWIRYKQDNELSVKIVYLNETKAKKTVAQTSPKKIRLCLLSLEKQIEPNWIDD
jgi:hypothetical protein